MNSFYASSSAQQSGIVIFTFLALLLCMGNLFVLFYRKNTKVYRALTAMAFVVLFALTVLMCDVIWNSKYNQPYRRVLPIPLWSLWLIVGALAVLLIIETIALLRSSKQAIRRDLIKQAMDTLQSAVCYFSPNGAVKLCNLKMHSLYRTLAQSDLQSLDELRNALDMCDEKSGVIKLPEERRTYLFPSGKAWHYTEAHVTTANGVAYTEACFTDVTELYEYGIKLQAQTKELEKLSRTLELLSYNAQSAAREQEILSAKTTLHHQIGAGVLAVRKLLQNGDVSKSDLAIELFQKAVRSIKNDSSAPSCSGELTEIMQDASTIGVKLIVSGNLPQNEDVAHIFVLAMRECLTNGVRHANASEVYAYISQNTNTATIKISNNGAVPKAKVVAKGGLFNLERYITALNGRMDIISAPSFALIVTLPLGRDGA